MIAALAILAARLGLRREAEPRFLVRHIEASRDGQRRAARAAFLSDQLPGRRVLVGRSFEDLQ